MNPENAYKEFDGNLLELEIFQNHFPILGNMLPTYQIRFFLVRAKAKKCIKEAN